MKNLALGEVASIFNGKTPSKKEQRNIGHPVLKIKDINYQGVFSGKYTSYVDNDLAFKNKTKLLKEGDIVILNSAHHARYIASKIGYISSLNKNALPVGEWTIIRSDNSKIDSKFLFYFFLNTKTQKQLSKLVKGIHIYPKDIEKIKINLPKIQVQKEISKKLSIVSMIDTLNLKQITKIERLKSSVFFEFFGNVLIDTKWKKKKINQVFNIVGGGTPSKKISRYYDGDIPFLTVRDFKREIINNYSFFISEEGLNNSATKLIKKNTILIVTRVGVGKIALNDRDCCINQDIKALDIINENLINKDFAFYFFKQISKYLSSKAVGATVKGINLEFLGNLEIILPPIDLQKKFVKKIMEINQLLHLKEISKQKTYDCLKSSVAEYYL